MARSLPSRRVAVTGATGFIGKHLLQGLHDAGAEIVAIGAHRHVERLESFPFPVELVQVNDKYSTGQAILDSKPEFVIHLGALVTTDRSQQILQETLRENFLATVSLLSASAEANVTRVVLMGSCEEYGPKVIPFDTTVAADPSSPYGASKAAATAYARMFSNSFGLPAIVLRPSVVYGPGQSERMLISQVMKALAEDRTVAVTAGAQTRDFIYVDDLVTAILRSLTVPRSACDVWNVGSGEVVTVRECLEQIERITGRSGLIDYGKRAYSENEIFQYELKVQETYDAFDWKPAVRLEEGLRRTWEWFRRRP